MQDTLAIWPTSARDQHRISSHDVGHPGRNGESERVIKNKEKARRYRGHGGPPSAASLVSQQVKQIPQTGALADLQRLGG